VRLAEEAAARARGAGERALLMAEELALDERGRERRAVEGDERRLAAQREPVDGAREELLAGAALAEDEHARVRGRDALHHGEELLHRRRLADDLVHAAHARDLVAQAPYLAGEAAVGRGAVDGGGELLRARGLAQVIEGALAHRRDRGLDRALAGEDDDRRVGVAAPRAPDE